MPEHNKFSFDLPTSMTPEEIGGSFLSSVDTMSPERINEILKPQVSDTDQQIINFNTEQLEIEQLNAERKAKMEDNARNRSRSPLEHAGDIASSIVVKGSMGVAEAAYGVADIASRIGAAGGDKFENKITQDIAEKLDMTKDEVVQQSKFSLDRLTDDVLDIVGVKGSLSQQFSKSREIVDAEFLSDPLQYSKEQVTKASQQRASGKQSRVDALIAEGHSQLIAKMKDEFGTIGETIGSLVDSPSAAVDMALESLPNMFLGGAVGSAATKSLVSGMTIKEGKEYLASEAGQAAATAIATKAGIATVAVTEGMSNGISAKAGVLALSHDALVKGSPLYNELLESGTSKEQAKQIVSEKVFDMTEAISGTVGAIASKLTGAAKFEGNLFNPGSQIAGLVSKTLTGGLVEGAEELIQGGAGTLAQNLAEKTYSDKDKDLTEGVGEGIGSGLVVGSLSGGVAGAGSKVVGATVEAVKGTATVAKKVTAPITKAVKDAKEVKAAVANKEMAKVVRDVKAKDYDPVKAFDVAAHKSQLPSDKADIPAHKAELQTHLTNITEATIEALDAVPTDTKAEDFDAKQNVANELMSRLEEATTRLDAYKDTGTLTASKAEATVEAAIKGDTDAKATILGSVPNLSTEQLTKLASSDAVTGDEKVRIDAHLKTRQAMADVESIPVSAGMRKVHADVIEGGQGFAGLKQYQSAIETHLAAGDTVSADKQLASMLKFAADHKKKVLAVTKAFDAHVKAPNSPAALKLSEAVETKFGLKIHKGSNNSGLIDLMGLELKATQAAFTESRHSIKLSTPQTSKAVVQEVSAEQETAPVQKAVKTVPETKTQDIPTDLLANGYTRKDAGKGALPSYTKDLGNGMVERITEHKNLGGEGTYFKRTAKAAFDYKGKKVYASYDSDGKLVLLTIKDVKTLKNKQELLVGDTTYNGKTDSIKALVDSVLGNVKTETKPTVDATPAIVIQPTLAKNFTVKGSGAKLLQSVAGLFTKVLPNTTHNQQELNDDQNIGLETIQRFEKKFSAIITKSLVKIDEKFASKDFSQYLLDDKGQMSDNVKSAVSLVTMNWIGTQASNTISNDGEAVNNLLGLSKEDATPPAAQELLSKVGVSRTNLAETLGAAIVKATGIVANTDADGDAQARLELSMGQLAIHSMIVGGLLESTNVQNEVLDIYRSDDTQSSDPKAYTSYVRAAATFDADKGYDVPRKSVKQAIDALKDSDGVMDVLFGIQSNETKPTLVAPGDKQIPTTIKGSFNKVPAKIRAAIKKHQARPMKNKTNVSNIFSFLSTDNQLLLSGLNPDFETNTHHTKWKSVQAVNESIARAVNQFHDHQTETGSKEFFFTHFVSKQMRLFMNSNTVNPQSNKIHRHLMGYDNDNVTLDPTNAAHMIQFKTAVAEALGVSVDKMLSEGAIEALGNKLADPVIQAGIDAINQINNESYDVDQGDTLQQAIVDAVKAGGEKVYSLDGLVAMAAYQNSNGKPFQANIFREVDGVTNGVIIGLFQLAAAGDFASLSKKLERGGFFFDDTQNLAEWAQKVENNDTYEDMSEAWVSQLTVTDALIDNNTEVKGKQLKADMQMMKGVHIDTRAILRDLIGEIARKTAKSPVMITSYGSGIGKVRNQFTETMLEDLYNKVVKAQIAGNVDELARISNNMSVLVGSPVNFTMETALTTSMNNAQEKQFKAIINAYYGSSLQAALEATFKDFIDNRTEINTALRVNFEAFNIVYTRTVAEQEAKEGRKISSEMKLKIVNQLQGMVPGFKSPMSDGTNDSIVVMKTDKKRLEGKENSVELKFNTRAKGKSVSFNKDTGTMQEDSITGKVSNRDSDGKVIKKGNKGYGFTFPEGRDNVKAQISEETYIDGGVSGAILGIHSMDAATMYGLLENYAALNVHDAAAFNLLEVMEGSEALNKSFLDVMAGYNMREEVQTSLVRSIAQLSKGKNSTADLLALNEILNTEVFKFNEENVTLAGYVAEFKAGTVKANKLREEILSKLVTMQQYNAGEGGQHFVDAQDTTTLSEKMETKHIDNEIKEFIAAVVTPTSVEVIQEQVNEDVNMVIQRLKILQKDDSDDVPNSAKSLLGRIAKLVNSGLSYTEAFKKLNDANGAFYDANAQIIENDTKAGKAAFDKFERVVEDLDILETALDTMFREEPTAMQGTLFSANRNIDPDNFGARATVLVNGLNTEQVLDTLDSVGNVKASTEHKATLKTVLLKVVTSVIEPLQLHIRTRGNENYGATRGQEVFINEGMGTLSNGTQMSAQEVYVHEVVHNVTRTGVESTSWAKRELLKLFNLVESQIKPEDFITTNSNGDYVDANDVVITVQSAGFARELAAATERYDYIFNNVGGAKGKNAYLHEFVALGLTNEAFIKKLSTLTGFVQKEAFWTGDIASTLLSIFQRIADFITGKITSSANITADKKLMVLAQQLADINARKKSTIYVNMDKVTDTIHSGIAKFVAEPLVKLAQSRIVQNSKSNIVRNVGSIVSKVPYTSIEAYREVMTKVTRRLGVTKDNLLSTLITEGIGNTEFNHKFHVLLRKSKQLIDQARTHIKTGVIKQVAGAFLTEVSSQQRKALLNVVMKTDMYVLVRDFSWTQIRAMVKDSAALEVAINKQEKLLKAYKGQQHYFRKMSESLGSYMAMGQHTQQHTPNNALAIAREFGTNNVDTLQAPEAAAKIIDTLASLYALKYTADSTKAQITNLMATEFTADAVNNGITFLAQVQEDSATRALESIFRGNPSNVIKGYTKEIFNSNITIMVAPLSEETALLREGYQRELTPLKRDPMNPSVEMFRYVSKDNLLTTYESGIASTTNKTAKGTDLIDVYQQQKSTTPVVDAMHEGAKLFAQKMKATEAIYKAGDSSLTTATMQPIFNEEGNVTQYRYLMDESTKVRILEKDGNFDTIMGAMEAATEDKMNTAVINNELVQLAKDTFDEQYASDPENFVTVGKNSTNPRYQEIYRMMPYEMRQEIKRVWGTDNMRVPAELVTLMFGQRKISAATSLLENKQFERLNVQVLRTLGLNLGKGVKTIENVWQELVKITKDVIVIKSGVVLLGNVLSNLAILKVSGVSARDIIKDHGIAVTYSKEYQSKTVQIEELKRELRVNPNATDVRRKQVLITRLENDLKENPIAELITAGVYQSIVEDIDTEDDQYTYKTKLQEWLTPKFVADGKVPTFLKDVGNNLIISHETQLYKSLRDATQLSDFIARYTLHQYNMKQKNKDGTAKFTKDSSYQDIVDTFINYDLPTHKGIQYANDMGLLMFTKFFVRIQKVIGRLATKKTSNFIALMLLQYGFDVDIEDILDSLASPENMVRKLHNPMDVINNLLDVPLTNLIGAGL